MEVIKKLSGFRDETSKRERKWLVELWTLRQRNALADMHVISVGSGFVMDGWTVEFPDVIVTANGCDEITAVGCTAKEALETLRAHAQEARTSADNAALCENRRLDLASVVRPHVSIADGLARVDTVGIAYELRLDVSRFDRLVKDKVAEWLSEKPRPITPEGEAALVGLVICAVETHSRGLPDQINCRCGPPRERSQIKQQVVDAMIDSPLEGGSVQRSMETNHTSVDSTKPACSHLHRTELLWSVVCADCGEQIT